MVDFADVNGLKQKLSYDQNQASEVQNGQLKYSAFSGLNSRLRYANIFMFFPQSFIKLRQFLDFLKGRPKSSKTESPLNGMNLFIGTFFFIN